MSINFPTPPAGATAALIKALTEVGETGLLSVEIRPPINTDFAHQVYYLALDDLIRFNGPAKAVLVSWRYLLQDKIAAEININPETNKFSFGTVCEGDCMPSLVAFRSYIEDPDLPAGPFEARLLLISGLHFSAIWLKADLPIRDLFIPLETSRELTGPKHHIALEELNHSLIPAALSKMTRIIRASSAFS